VTRALTVASAAVGLWIAVALGWVPGTDPLWGLRLWQILPRGVDTALAVLLLPLLVPRTRLAIVAVLGRVAARPPGPRVFGAAVIALPALFWVIRERRLQGDATILVQGALSGASFSFPEIGGTFLLQLSMRLSSALGHPGTDLFQALVCVSGGLAACFCMALARRLAPSPERVWLAAAFLLCGGILRVMAGHLEVYGFQVMFAAAYLWAGCAYLQGRQGWLPAALALGGGIFIHVSFGFLAPSFVALVLLAEPRPALASTIARCAAGLAVAIAPTAVFLLGALAAGHTEELRQALGVVLQMAEADADPNRHESWLRGWGLAAGSGTKYVILFGPHWRYLANAFFLLAPAAIPVLLAFGVAAPRRFLATPEAIFLSAASVSMLAYTAVVRPVWGPWDWDVFCLTALCLSTLAAYLLVSLRAPVGQLGALLVAATLLLATLPLLVAGVAAFRDAGPFAHERLVAVEGETTMEAFERQLGPWL